jgi:polygalacturonase
MVNIVVRNNTFSGTDTGLRFKSAPERGGKTENIWISDIYMSDIQGEAVVFETSYADRPVGRDDATAAETENFLPNFQDIHIARVTCRHAADDPRHHPGRLPLLLYGRSIPGRRRRDASA